MWDIFISHATEDKENVARPLAKALSEKGLKVWYDELTLTLGDSLHQSIERGLTESRYGVVILSPSFFAKKWTQRELNGLTSREITRDKVILPIWHNITREQIEEFSPVLADKFGVSTDQGLNIVIQKILEVFYQEKVFQENHVLRDITTMETESPSLLTTSYIPPERRIRIQACNNCNLNCPACHWDEFEVENLPHYNRVINLIKNLKRDSQKTFIYPRPNLSFTLTGGEPLLNEQHWKEFIQIVKVDEKDADGNNVNSAYLLTNGTQFTDDKIDVIKQEGLRKIRVSLNYDNNGEIPEKDSRIEGIKNLLNRIDDVEIRFNHVIRTNSSKKVRQFNTLILKEFKPWIPRNVKEIGFIQETGNDSIDVFRVAKEWFDSTGLNWQEHYLGTRKLTTTLESGLRVTFIKLNCDVKDDYVSRCFDCVQERDIGISADARVRICSGWNENLKPQFKYAQIDFDAPLVGIAGVIRRQYGFAGFYGHFPFLINKLESKTVPECFYQKPFDMNSLKGLLKQIGYPTTEENICSIIPHIAGIISKENSPIKKLYEEGSYDQQSLEYSTKLCKLLLRAAYDVAKDCRAIHKGNLLNQILLILAYLTVDEDLFSTGRTILVRGMTKKLIGTLTGRSQLEHAFLAQSTYCIATIAFENVDPRFVERFINAILKNELQEKSCEILYLKGCIYRQLSGEEKEQDKKDVIVQRAISAFEKCYEISEQKLKSKKDELYKEIRAESQRSLGAIKKNIPERKEESRQHFVTSEFLGAMDKTFLRYHSLFSDGYASLLNYFKNEYENPDFRIPEEGYRAYKCLSDSIALNSEFYASLIRIALLELAFDHVEYAQSHLLQAKSVFSRRGLLTDQEYLNSILCRLIYLYGLYKVDRHNFDLGNLSQLLDLTIEDCTKVGARDIKCVQEDADILKKIIRHEQRNLVSDKILWNLELHIDEFINECEKLLQHKQRGEEKA
ncbi:TIR domain-containing protein [Candidatus Dojkabacteria bacterium]|nr:TIR domain-containing protein [Candidatus Dojkabacteria bacterium]